MSQPRRDGDNNHSESSKKHDHEHHTPPAADWGGCFMSDRHRERVELVVELLGHTDDKFLVGRPCSLSYQLQCWAPLQPRRQVAVPNLLVSRYELPAAILGTNKFTLVRKTLALLEHHQSNVEFVVRRKW